MVLRCLFCIIFIRVFLFEFGMLHAQQTSRHIPLTIQRAIENETRTDKGIPGKNYWQNHSDYTINANFSPEKNVLKGNAVIQYHNESPDTLSFIVLNLYQNIFQKGNSRDWNVGTLDLHDGVAINRLLINGQAVEKTDCSSFGTKLVVKLMEKFLPKSILHIEIDWEVPITSTVSIRVGQYSDTSFFIGYWYPQVAVYDDIDGWDMIHYRGSVEFYNDVNNFDVTIQVPAEWMVWATGIWQNPNEILSDETVARYKQAQKSNETVAILSRSDYQSKNIFRENREESFRFKASQVPDFAFAVAKGFNWDGSSLVVDNETKHAVFVNAVYPDHTKSGKDIMNYSRFSIDYMSQIMPGIPFPYPKFTTYLNGRINGGMEFPMMANNGDPDDAKRAFELTFHEIAHTYMPFYMGTNEKKYAWMDEGWARWWPQALSDSLFSSTSYIKQLVESYEQKAGTEYDTPPMVLNHLLSADYQVLRMTSYERSAMAYAFLQETLGPELFRKALHYYMNTWAEKHPIPADFFACFEHIAKKDVSWFIKPWFYDYAYPDLALQTIKKGNVVVVENIGGLPFPVQLEITFEDGSKAVVYESITIWENNSRTVEIAIPSQKKVVAVVLGSETIPDSNRKNNLLKIN
ncbi:MAG: M1 family metallopeptidase [Lentimicrobiaceae bacterium]|jgi:hypothetical protein|nr:M1 family metallopeptidase [Lentimicrobiaceae bacterium]